MNVKSIRRDNVRALAKSIGGISKLAIKLDKSQSQISHLIGASPIKNIGDKIASQIEAAFDKSAGWLDQEHYHVEEAQALYRNEEGQLAILCRQVPLITWEEAVAWNQLAYKYKPKSFEQLMVTTAQVSPLAFALRVYGDWMESPSGVSFPDGTIIIADPDQVAAHGAFVVVSVSPHREATLKQLVSDGNKRYLKPLNSRYPIVEYTVHTMIYGVVKQLVMAVDDCMRR